MSHGAVAKYITQLTWQNNGIRKSILIKYWLTYSGAIENNNSHRQIIENRKQHGGGVKNEKLYYYIYSYMKNSDTRNKSKQTILDSRFHWVTNYASIIKL